MIDGESDIIRFDTLDRVEAEAKVKERVVEDVSAYIRSRMEAKLSERERAEF